MDASIIDAPSSTKNRKKERDPEMHQTRKGRQWYFGMKAHIGVPEDNAEAVLWTRKAAEQGHYWAQFRLGEMYADGDGVPKNHIQAYAWLSIAAAQGGGLPKIQKKGWLEK